jgi:hypothetical protein
MEHAKVKMLCTLYAAIDMGETGQAHRLWISGHQTAINRVKKEAKLDDVSNNYGTSYHFGGKEHNFKRDAEVAILEVGTWRTALGCKNKEDYYILKFDTLQPSGMNVKKGIFSSLFKGKI